MNFPIEESVPSFPEGFQTTECIFSENSEPNNLHHRIVSLLETPKDVQFSEEVYDDYTLKSTEYRKIFSSEDNCNKLLAKFNIEKKELLKGNPCQISHSLENCSLRALQGYYMFKYNFNTAKRSVCKVQVLDPYFEIIKSNKIHKIKINSMHGVLIGAVSSTFHNFKKVIEKHDGKIHKFFQCFSLVTEFRTYDFGTIKDNDRLDLCILMSWLISLNSKIPTSIPFTKSNLKLGYLVLKTINYKIRSAARKKYMSVVELFMVKYKKLSILVTLKEKKDWTGFNKVKQMLDVHFSGLSKFARFIMKSVLNFMKYYDEMANENYFRVNILLGKRIRFLKSQLHNGVESNAFTPKFSKAFAYLVPSSKSVFQNNRQEDPTFELMRNRTHKLSIASSKRSSISDTIY